MAAVTPYLLLIGWAWAWMQVAPPDVPSTSSAPAGATWNGEVAMIIQRRCVSCHRSGGAAPFPLDDHASVANRATFLGDVVESGRMPPWLPSHGGFRGDRALTDVEETMLHAWIAAGAPVGEGDPVRLPPPRALPVGRGDRITLAMPDAGVIPEESDVAWHAGELDQIGTTLPVGNEKVLRVQAIRQSTAAPQAMRVTSLVFDTTGAGRYLDDRDSRVGFLMAADAGARPSGVDGVLLGGDAELRWPRGFHTEVGPGADLVAEVHYRPTGRPERFQERFQLELVPADASSRPLRWLPLGVFRVVIPAGTKERIETPVELVPVDLDLVGLSIRALEVCVAVEIVARPPGGEELVLLAIDDWDHHQRETYVLERPRRLPRGTELVARFSVDNTAANPRNPDDPPVDIRRGRRTGILLAMLHVAAADDADDDEIEGYGGGWVRRQGRR